MASEPTREQIIQWFHEEMGEEGLDIVAQPLFEEPDVQAEALSIFMRLSAKAFGEGEPPHITLQMYAVQSRALALILHGYHREHVALEDMEKKVWDILIQYQAMPLASQTFRVEAPTEEVAMELARAKCEEIHECLGIVLAVDGMPFERLTEERPTPPEEDEQETQASPE